MDVNETLCDKKVQIKHKHHFSGFYYIALNPNNSQSYYIVGEFPASVIYSLKTFDFQLSGSHVEIERNLFFISSAFC